MANWRAFLLRRLLGRLRIGDDIVKHLSTFQRLGEALEVEAPREMLPVGARTVFRAIRTRAAVQVRPQWIWPYWIERQLDPDSPGFTPRGHLPFLTNVTHRNWTMIGNPGSPWEAIVDERGLVTPWFDGWSLDWYVGTEDGWRLAPRNPALRQRLLGATPVVRTALPVPGGEAAQLVYAVDNGEELVVAEVENRSADEIEVCFSLRPYNPEGLAVVERLAIDHGSVLVDGRPAIVLARPPDRFVLSTYAAGDSAQAVFSGRHAPGIREVVDHVGLAQATLAYRVAPGACVRVAMPMTAKRRTRSHRVARRRVERLPSVDVKKLPSAYDASARWQRLLARGLQVRVPDGRLQAALNANRAYMLLFHDGDEITPGPFTYHRFWFRDAAYQLLALDRWGFHEEAAEVLRSYPGRQHRDGYFYSQHREWDSNGAAIFAIAEHYRLTGDDELLRALLPSVLAGARWIKRTRRKGRRSAGAEGLLPPGISAEHLGPFDYYYWDDFWALRGLMDAAALARVVGDDRSAQELSAEAKALREALTASIRGAASRLRRRVIPAGPSRGVDPGMIGSLVAVAPLALLAPHDPLVLGTLDAIEESSSRGEAFYQGIAHTGLGTYLTLQLAFAELEAGRERAWRRLRWMLDAATPTFTWPEAVHPRLGGGCMGDGHHGWAAADFLSLVRNVLVREAGDGLAILTLLPPEWGGKPVEVHDAPTRRGRISWRLSWSQGKPQLWWRCERDGVRLTAPSLDATWSTAEQTGTVTFEKAAAAAG